MNSSVYIPRWLQDQLSLALRTFPLVVLSGARQSGKSTLSTHLQPNRRYLTYYQAKHFIRRFCKLLQIF